MLAPGAVGSAIRCRLELGHDEVRYGGDPVHEGQGVASLLIRWRLVATWDDDAQRPRSHPTILEVVGEADTEPLVSYGATGYRPRQYVPPGEVPPPQLRLLA